MGKTSPQSGGEVPLAQPTQGQLADARGTPGKALGSTPPTPVVSLPQKPGKVGTSHQGHPRVR